MNFRRFCFVLFFLCFPSLSSRAKKEEKPQKTAFLALEKALKNYYSQSFKLKVQQELFLASIKESIKSSGFLNKQDNQFQLQLEGQPSSLLLFDGQFLWYQADTREKVVFQSKNHPQIHLLTGLFSGKKFFDLFEIKKSKQKNKAYILHILPKKEIKGLKEIFMKVDTHISEVRIIWKDLNNWQKLSFSKPIHKSFPKNFFKFSKQGFQIIKRD